MGAVQIFLKKDLLPLIAYPGNFSRRYKLKKIPGTSIYAIAKAKQLARWWATDHGILRYADIIREGEFKKDILYQIRWDNSLVDIQSGKYHISHFWKLKNKEGDLNEPRPEHWYGCDKCKEDNNV